MPNARLIDTSKCMGCRGCQVACKQWNDLPAVHTTQRGTYENPPELSAHNWIKVEFTERPGEWLLRAHTCMHCTEASCEKVCPTGAISHLGEVVYIDPERCIGCGYCVQACPFGVPHRDEEITGTARKCRFCIDRITSGLEPACVKTCPTGAISFGDRAELLVTAENKVQALRANGHPRATLYGANELGGLHTLYVLTDTPSVYNLPEAPQLATSNAVAQWLSGIITAGVVAAVPFWLLFRRKKELSAQQSKVEGGVR